jgi:hypothetical protein
MALFSKRYDSRTFCVCVGKNKMYSCQPSYLSRQAEMKQLGDFALFFLHSRLIVV